MASNTQGSEFLNVVIPVYNEEKCISAVLNTWLKQLDELQIKYRIIVLNDGSKDGTQTVLNTLNHQCLQVTQHLNMGHGRSIRRGYELALQNEANWIFQVDSDDQFDSLDFLKLWEKRNDTHFVLGTRANRNDPLHRLIISRIMRTFVNLCFGVKLKDPNSPFRLMRSDFLKQGLAKIPTEMFAPNIALSIAAYKFSPNIVQIPVTHKPRVTGTISIVRLKLLKVCVKSLFELIDLQKAFKN